MPKFAAHRSSLYMEHDFLRRFEAAKEDHFDGVEYVSPYEHTPELLQTTLRDLGLQQVLFKTPGGGKNRDEVLHAWQAGLRGTACLPERQDEFRYGVALALDYVEALNCPQIHVMSGIPHETDSHIQKHWRKSLEWAAEKAASIKSDCKVLIEPINQFDMPGYYLHTQEQAHAALALIDHPNLAVQMDFYHCQRTEGDAAGLLQRYLPTGSIHHAQIAGTPSRNEPDVGELDDTALLQILNDAQWPGWIGCEYKPLHGTRNGLGWLRKYQANQSTPQDR